MANQKFVLLTVAALALLCGNASAQSNNLITCASAGSINIYSSLSVLSGSTWYEVARSPSSDNSCVAVDFNYDTTSSQLNINVTYANSTENLGQNYTDSVNTGVYPAGGVSFPYTVFYPGGKIVTYKFLAVNNNNVLVCGYNPSNVSDSFGLVLSTTRSVTLEQAQAYASSFSSTYANFADLTLVNQSDSCTAGSDDSTENKYYFFGVVRKSINGANPFPEFPLLDARAKH